MQTQLSSYLLGAILSFLLAAGAYCGFDSAPNRDISAWQPDAGLVLPYTDAQGVTVAASSGGTASVVIDNDIQSFWQSDAPYPTGYISRADQNILLDLANAQSTHLTSKDNPQYLTDGNLDNAVSISVKNGQAAIHLNLPEAQPIYALSIKAQSDKPLQITAIDSQQKTHLIGSYLSTDSYQLRRYTPRIDMPIVQIAVVSSEAFSAFEIAALNAPPTEYVTIRLPQIQQIGWIDSRHYTADQNASEASLQLSSDGKQFKTVARLNPNAIPIVPVWIDPPQNAQYIRIAQSVADKDWAKVSVWEADAYDPNGPFGEAPPAQAQNQTIAEIIGVNGIWGWGNKKGSVGLDHRSGAQLYARVATHARNYHEMDWDITDPDHIPNYTAMARGQGTEAQPWLNWDTEYALWQKAGLRIELSVKFDNNAVHDPHKWNDPQQAAYNYGYALARHFGPTYGNGMVEAIEVGNEPWDYSPTFYRAILRGMASGIKAADPSIITLPCALQSGYAQAEQTDLKNYAGLRITPNEAQFIDAWNCHYYSHLTDRDGIQRGTYPEHPQSGLRGVLNDLRFCRQNLPDKPIYLTEWGWDSDGAGEACTHSQCVSEHAQALYAVRGAMWLMRLGIDRLTWYFYANGTGGSIIYNQSGLTGSVETNFAQKSSFHNLESLRHLVGDKRFLSVLREDNEAYIYLLGKPDGKPTHLMAWRPVAAEDTQTAMISVAMRQTPKQAWYLDGQSSEGTTAHLPRHQNGSWQLAISSVPILVSIE